MNTEKELEYRMLNKVIAEFMNVDLSQSYGNIPPSYHDSWDTLMSVVEKIESIEDPHHGHFGVHISSNSCTIQATNFRPDKIDINNPHYFADYYGKDKKEATHIAVFYFIQWYNLKNSQPEEEEGFIPNNLEEAIDFIIKQNRKEDNDEVKKMTENNFIVSTHHSLGRFLRNTWGLWYQDTEISRWFTDTLQINHADDRSSIILCSVHRRLNGLPLELEEQVEKYRKHWEKAGYKDGIHPIASK